MNRACRRCRKRHQRCHVEPHDSACSSCLRANVDCDSGKGDLRIRFSTIGVRRRSQRRNKASSTQHPRIGPSGTRSAHVGHKENDCSLVPQPLGQRTIMDDTSPSLHLEPNVESLDSWGCYSDALLSSVVPVHENTDVDSTAESPAEYRHEVSNLDPANSLIVIPPSRTIDSPSLKGRETWRPSNGKCLWPLQDEEARLVKYFLSTLASWFDYCDPNMNFKTHVQSTVSHNAAIAYAVLAISARHRELTMGVRNHKSNEYERACLQVLIPSLSDETMVLGDSLLASAVLLRLLEEMTEPVDHHSIDKHTVSVPMLMRIQSGSIQATDFSDAAMIVVLRQEIFVANMKRRPVEHITEYCRIESSLEPASEAVWAHRMIFYTARVTSFVYGDGTSTTRDWDCFFKYLDDWEERKPASFQPINFACTEPSSACTINEPCESCGTRRALLPKSKFPAIYYTYDCPVAAQQYRQLSRILLLAHNPRVAALGLGRSSCLQGQESEIRQSVRIICGIAKSNLEYMPASLTAGLTIAMCGELFSDPAEVAELFQMVSEAELHLGWPSLKVRDRLKAFWGL